MLLSGYINLYRKLRLTTLKGPRVRHEACPACVSFPSVGCFAAVPCHGLSTVSEEFDALVVLQQVADNSARVRRCTLRSRLPQKLRQSKSYL